MTLLLEASMQPGLDTDAFAAVSLDDIVAEAALLTRVDRKYLVPTAVAARTFASMSSASRVLEIDGRRTFRYDSVYFDTADRVSYRLTAQRRRRRFKLRTRTYVDTGTAYLELKTKSGRGSTVKERIAYDTGDRDRLTSEGRDFVAKLLARDGHDTAVVHELRPVLGSRYRRTTILLTDGSRATIDTALEWEDLSGVRAAARSFALDGYVIIESKSAGRPSELDRALWRSGYRPTGISKFGTGTAALHPELPSNKWARVLRGPFQLASTKADS